MKDLLANVLHGFCNLKNLRYYLRLKIVTWPKFQKSLFMLFVYSVQF